MGYIKTVVSISQNQHTGTYGVDIALYEYTIACDWYGKLKINTELITCRAFEVEAGKPFECESEYEASAMRNAVEDAFSTAKEHINEDPEYAVMVFDYNSVAQYQMATMPY